MVLQLNKLDFPSPKDAFVPNLVEIGPQVLEKPFVFLLLHLTKFLLFKAINSYKYVNSISYNYNIKIFRLQKYEESCTNLK